MAVIYIDGVKADCIALTSEGEPYIVGIGTSYSALPVYGDENDILKIQFKFKNTDETTDNKMVIGSAFSGKSDYLLYMTVENGQPIYSYAVANNYTYIKAPRSTTDYDDIELGYDYMKVNGVTYNSQSPAKHYNHTPIYVFGSTYTGSGVFGEIKIYKNDVLTYDLVPSVNSSGVACFKDILNSDTEYLSTGAEYYYFKDGGAEPTVDTSKLLFKDGAFYNQDILKVGLYKGQVSDGELEFTGLRAGFLIEEINLPQGITDWDICFKLRVNNAQTLQCGTCQPNLEASDLVGIISYGTNRITYNGNSLSPDTNYYYGLKPVNSSSNSVFIGDATTSGEHSMVFYIEEMTMNLYDGPQIVRS